MREKAIENFKNGYSCSESVVKAAADAGLVNKSLISVATPFAGGMSSGCVCGAVAGAQIIIGAKYGRHDSSESRAKAQACAKQIVSDFKAKHKFTCCKALTTGFEMGTPERKNNCCKFVGDCAEMIENICTEEKV